MFGFGFRSLAPFPPPPSPPKSPPALPPTCDGQQCGAAQCTGADLEVSQVAPSAARSGLEGGGAVGGGGGGGGGGREKRVRNLLHAYPRPPTVASCAAPLPSREAAAAPHNTGPTQAGRRRVPGCPHPSPLPRPPPCTAPIPPVPRPPVPCNPLCPPCCLTPARARAGRSRPPRPPPAPASPTAAAPTSVAAGVEVQVGVGVEWAGGRDGGGCHTGCV